MDDRASKRGPPSPPAPPPGGGRGDEERERHTASPPPPGGRDRERGSPHQTLHPFRALAADPFGPARAAKAAGRKVVGHVGPAVPTDLIRAAGLVPVPLAGRPDGPTDTADRWLDDVFDGDVRSLADDILTGRHGWLDLIVIPRGYEPHLQLIYALEEIRRLEPGLRFPEIVLLDLLGSPHWRTERWNRTRLALFRDRLAALAGAPVADDALRAAMDAEAGVRRRLRAAAALRHEGPPRLSGADALAILAAPAFVPPETVVPWLDALLVEPPPPLPAGRPRLMLKGLGFDAPSLHALIADTGADVVADDHPWGDPLADRGDPGAGDPLDVLADQMLREVATPRSFPQAVQDRRMMDRVRAAGVDGVLVVLPEHDDTLGWDWPGQKAMLEAAGVPAGLVLNQPFANPDAVALRAAVADLLDRIAARRAA
jgi:benzoyl-CoA reductase/2-hydroxyglutaryl-CoA dehydratase subunit BcrC/BadD/HgdB